MVFITFTFTFAKSGACALNRVQVLRSHHDP
jgi:hypothetical protein